MNKSVISAAWVGLLAILAAGCTTDLPEAAGGPVYFAKNGRQVYPLRDSAGFEVLARPGDAGVHFFCAAGDYAWARLGARASERVVLVVPAGDSIVSPGRRGAVFTLAEPGTGAEFDGGSIDMGQPGKSFTVASARFLCNNQPVRLF